MTINTNPPVRMQTNGSASSSSYEPRTAMPVAVEYTETNTRRPTDRVRWPAILAGIFTVLAALIVFVVLGVALGLTAYDANNLRGLGIGAGVYGVISALVAFALGGFIAAKTAARRGTGNAILQSGMVWIVTIALIVNFIGTGVGTILNVAGNAAGTVAVAGANLVGDAAQAVAANPTLQANAASVATSEAPAVEAAVGAVVTQIQDQVNGVSAQDVEQAAQNASAAAWWALLGLGVSAAAALGGGLLGTRSRGYLADDYERDAVAL